MKHTRSEQLIALLLIAIGVFLRLLPHPSNFTPVMSIALLAGAVLPMTLALTVPLIIMIITDLFIGTHDLYWLTWACFFLTSCIGVFTQSRGLKRGRIVLASLAGSVVFFVLTNLGVFLFEKMYPKSLSGFMECYWMALPFFRNQLIGDLFYNAVFFGAFFFASRCYNLRRV